MSEQIDRAAEALHAEVDVWLENVPDGRCPGAYVAEQALAWQRSQPVEVSEEKVERGAVAMNRIRFDLSQKVLDHDRSLVRAILRAALEVEG